jgi:hypothetical protein
MAKRRKETQTSPVLRLDRDADGAPTWLLTYHDGIVFNVLLVADFRDKGAALRESAELLHLKPEQINFVEAAEMWVAERVQDNNVGIIDHDQLGKGGKSVHLLTVHRVDGHDPWPLARILAKWLNDSGYRVKATK